MDKPYLDYTYPSRVSIMLAIDFYSLLGIAIETPKSGMDMDGLLLYLPYLYGTVRKHCLKYSFGLASTYDVSWFAPLARLYNSGAGANKEFILWFRNYVDPVIFTVPFAPLDTVLTSFIDQPPPFYHWVFSAFLPLRWFISELPYEAQRNIFEGRSHLKFQNRRVTLSVKTLNTGMELLSNSLGILITPFNALLSDMMESTNAHIKKLQRIARLKLNKRFCYTHSLFYIEDRPYDHILDYAMAWTLISAFLPPGALKNVCHTLRKSPD